MADNSYTLAKILDELRVTLEVPEGRSIIEVATERMIERQNLYAEVKRLRGIALTPAAQQA